MIYIYIYNFLYQQDYSTEINHNVLVMKRKWCFNITRSRLIQQYFNQIRWFFSDLHGAACEVALSVCLSLFTVSVFRESNNSISHPQWLCNEPPTQIWHKAQSETGRHLGCNVLSVANIWKQLEHTQLWKIMLGLYYDLTDLKAGRRNSMSPILIKGFSRARNLCVCVCVWACVCVCT